MAFITQNSIDGQYETWIDGCTIRGADYERVERLASEVCCWRAQRQVTEDALDELEQQRAEDQEGLTIEPWAMFAFIVLMVGVFSVLAYFGW